MDGNRIVVIMIVGKLDLTLLCRSFLYPSSDSRSSRFRGSKQQW